MFAESLCQETVQRSEAFLCFGTSDEREAGPGELRRVCKRDFSGKR